MCVVSGRYPWAVLIDKIGGGAITCTGSIIGISLMVLMVLISLILFLILSMHYFHRY